MLRKIFSVGALVAVAVTFGVGNAWANTKNADPSAATHSNGGPNSIGFSDGRI